MRSRCKFCGLVKAKNTTRQFEHLQTCAAFLDSPDGQAALADGRMAQDQAGRVDHGRGQDIWRGGAPNPNLMIDRQPVRPRQSTGREAAHPPRIAPAGAAPPNVTLSLAHLLQNKHADAVKNATQATFLEQAGRGILSANAVQHWFVQQSHLSRTLIPFTGNVIGKLRLPHVANPQQDSTSRVMELLVSAVSNVKREWDFIQNTQNKYGLQVADEPPT